MTRILVMLVDCDHDACRRLRPFDQIILMTVEAQELPDDSLMIDRESAEHIGTMVMN